jgi:hypothetical protein
MRAEVAAIALTAALLWAGSASASELVGPARFCGYSPIIDLLPDERVITLQGGIHGGSFRWEGAFGSLEVDGVGWARRPPGRMARQATGRGHVRFEQRRSEGKYTVAIWNRAHAAAYFSSPRPLTRQQLAAIDRVDLFEEGQDPEGCDLRTIFVWG